LPLLKLQPSYVLLEGGGLTRYDDEYPDDIRPPFIRFNSVLWVTAATASLMRLSTAEDRCFLTW